MIKKIKKLLAVAKKEMHARFCFTFGYMIWSSEYKSAHYCMTWKEAKEWMSCYSGCAVLKCGFVVACNSLI